MRNIQCHLLACVVAFVAAIAMGQEDLLVPGDFQELYFFPDRPSHTADELLADNARARYGLRGPVQRVVTIEGWPEELLNSHVFVPEATGWPPTSIVEFDTNGRLVQTKSCRLVGESTEHVFTTNHSESGFLVMNRRNWVRVTKLNERVDSVLMKFGFERHTLRVLERNDDGTPTAVEIDHGVKDPACVNFDDQGRVSRIEQEQEAWTYTWGDGTLEIRDETDVVTTSSRLDEFGNLLSWHGRAFDRSPHGGGVSYHAMYTYDDHGNWITCKTEVLADEKSKPWMTYTRTITYFDEPADE